MHYECYLWLMIYSHIPTRGLSLFSSQEKNVVWKDDENLKNASYEPLRVP